MARRFNSLYEENCSGSFRKYLDVLSERRILILFTLGTEHGLDWLRLMEPERSLRFALDRQGY